MDTKALVVEAAQRYARVRDRFERTSAGAVQRRLTELELSKKALILSAMALMLFIPALITLSAVLPLGSKHGVASGFARHLGLSPEATRDLQRLFPTRATVRGSTTVLSAIVTALFAYSWPAELRRGYEFIWDLPPQGFRAAAWRPLAWLVVFLCAFGGLSATHAALSGGVGTAVDVLVLCPLTGLWVLWSLRLLLGGRVAYRALVPSAVVTALCLLGLSAYMSFYLPRSIVENFDRYGPIGVVFALLSWMIGFSLVMLGGPLIGHAIYEHRRRDPSVIRSG